MALFKIAGPGPTQSPVTCDFETADLCGYIQDSTDPIDWTRNSGTTPTVGTGPSFDHTYSNSSGRFYLFES